ncbi:MAG: Gfo/Idh/MocA family protein [Candidatus Acetothermia bacterium]
MNSLRVGVIGVGLMGEMHARTYSQLPNVQLAAVADPSRERRDYVAGQFGVEAKFSDYEELLKLDYLDAVSVCTPDEMHRDPVVAAAEAGKDIFLEKPLATELDDARRILNVVQESGVKLMVGYLLRFDPRYAQVKEAIDRGDLGDPVYIVSHRNSPHTEGPARYEPGTSLTTHVAVHDLDLIHWFTGAEPEVIQAAGSDKKLSDKQMMDAISALLTFPDGSFASVNYSWILPDTSPTKLDARMEVVGTEGSAYIGVPHQQGVLMATEEGITTPDLHHNPVVGDRLVGDLREEIMAFVDSALNDERPPITGEEAFASLKAARAIIDALSD